VLKVMADGFHGRSIAFVAGRNAPSNDRIITLHRLIELSGRVVDQSGQPVPEAVVAFHCSFEWEPAITTSSRTDGTFAVMLIGLATVDPQPVPALIGSSRGV